MGDLDPAVMSELISMVVSIFALSEAERIVFGRALPRILQYVARYYPSLDARELAQHLSIMLIEDGDRLRRSWDRSKGAVGGYLQKILLREAHSIAYLVKCPLTRPSRDSASVIAAKSAASEYCEVDEEIQDPTKQPMEILLAIEEGDTIKAMSEELRRELPWLLGRMDGRSPQEVGCLQGAKQRVRHVLDGLAAFSKRTGIAIPPSVQDEAVKAVSGWRNRRTRNSKRPITAPITL